LKRSGSGLVLKRHTRHANRRTERQAEIQMWLSELAGKWQGLTSTQQEMWRRYASFISPVMSGHNAFISLNMNLLKARHSDLSIILSPPPIPSTPGAIFGFSVTTFSVSQNVISWISPSISSVYVSLYHAVRTGYSDVGKEAWHFVETVRSDEFTIYHSHSYPSNSILSYKAFSIDAFGRTSPETLVLVGSFSAYELVPGFYGETSYGYSHYGA
jgi:hypothetical protein